MMSLRPAIGVAGWIQTRFLERARAMASTLDEVASVNQIPHSVATYLHAHGLPKVVVAWPEFSRLDWRAAGIDFASRPAVATDLVGITGAVCAIAETGTLLLCRLAYQRRPPGFAGEAVEV